MNFNSDKGTRHSLVDFYTLLFHGQDIKSILEIGIKFGGSLDLYRHLFPEAHITGVDVQFRDELHKFDDDPTIDIKIKGLKDLRLNKTFDLIVEDSTHIPSDQIYALNTFSNKVNPGGWLIIEDIGHGSGDPIKVAKKIANSFTGNKNNLFIVDRRFLRPNTDDEIIIVYRNI